MRATWLLQGDEGKRGRGAAAHITCAPRCPAVTMACTCAASRAAASRSAGASSSRPSRPARRGAPLPQRRAATRAEAPATQTQATAISFEEQRRIAKAMTQYYEDLKIEAEVEGKVGLGWTEDNEVRKLAEAREPGNKRPSPTRCLSTPCLSR